MTTTRACAVDWTSVAEQWLAHRDHVEGMKATLTADLMAGLALVAGDRVLELGGGTGALAARLADAIQPGGTLVASDIAPGMVELIRAATAGRPGVRVAEIDAADIPLDDGSLDAVVFRMGLMLLVEPAVALAEMRRVLAPGGRIGVAVWAGPQDNPWLTTVGMAAMMHGLVQGGPPVGPGAPFSLADPDVLQALVTDAGFSGVQVRPVDAVAVFADVDEYFDTVRCLAPPLAAAFAAASLSDLAAVRDTVTGVVAKYRTDDGLRIPVRSLLCLAHV
jgi:SAM-dependent methyltransferase